MYVFLFLESHIFVFFLRSTSTSFSLRGLRGIFFTTMIIGDYSIYIGYCLAGGDDKPAGARTTTQGVVPHGVHPDPTATY